MVFYTCNACGESLKKNKVEKHAYTCYNCQYLTCIDCNQDFWGDDYKLHKSCISESEKYGAVGSIHKSNKGELKQHEWMKKIEEASETNNLSKEGKKLLETLLSYDNIPRKKGKFLNFLKNSLKIRSAKLGDEVWEAFSTTNKPAASAENPKVEDKQKSQKRKIEEEDEDSTKNKKSKISTERLNESLTKVKDEKVVSFPWNKTFKLCLKASGDGGMSLKKLKKKVLNEYENFEGNKRSRSIAELELLFQKKINKNQKIKIEKSRVLWLPCK